MRAVLVTGSAGLIGAEAVRFYDQRSERVLGIDNNMRAEFFGVDGDAAFFDFDAADAAGGEVLGHGGGAQCQAILHGEALQQRIINRLIAGEVGAAGSETF